MDIKVNVSTQFIAERSNIERSIYAYVYFIDIVNNDKLTVQLINRHWKVFSGNKQIADVKGEGVIGETPVISPGMTYSYNSFTVISDNTGYMTGTYTFKDEQNNFFDIEIPKFELLYFAEDVVH